MCTAISYRTLNHYFGRTLDLEHTYCETVTVTPRNFTFAFRAKGILSSHYAMIGMATVSDGYPLYYDAANECGLAIAGLNFPQNAVYFPKQSQKDNIAPYEFIPWILSQCKDLQEVRERLSALNLCHIPFSKAFPLSPLHWLISDYHGSVTVESTEDGLHVYENPVGVLTNNPPFPYHMTHLCDYMNLTAANRENRFKSVPLQPYSKGMGAIGLPGDLSSASRFVRAAFVKLNSVSGSGENESVSQFFHILGAVSQQRGCNETTDGIYEITQYTSCINTNLGIYYYTTYENQCVSAVDMHHCDLNGTDLYLYPLTKTQFVNRQN